jgi:hypothetical protein
MVATAGLTVPSGPKPLWVLGNRHDAAGERQHADRPQQQREILVIGHGTGEAIAVPNPPMPVLGGNLLSLEQMILGWRFRVANQKPAKAE